MAEVDAGVVLSLFTIVVTLIGFYLERKARLSLLASHHAETAERERMAERRKAKALRRSYQPPVIRAAYALQSRLWNIIDDDFLTKTKGSTDPRDHEYAIEHTVFLFAQWFAWIEIVNRTVRVLEFVSENPDRETETGNARKDEDLAMTRLISKKLAKTSDVMRGSHLGQDKSLSVWSGEQQAIGNLMLEWFDVPVTAVGIHSMQALGFGDYMKMRNTEEWNYWLGPLREELRSLADGIAPALTRLTEMQYALVDVVIALDKREIVAPLPAHVKTSRETYMRVKKGEPAGERRGAEPGRRGMQEDGWWNNITGWDKNGFSATGKKGPRRQSEGGKPPAPSRPALGSGTGRSRSRSRSRSAHRRGSRE